MTLKFRFNYITSLKEKRSLIKSMLEKLKRRFNISIIESDHHDDLNLATISLVCIAKHRDVGARRLNQVIDFIEFHYPVEIYDIDKEEC